MPRIAVLFTAVLGSGVGHVIAGRDRSAALWIALSTAALAGAALIPELLYAGTALRIPCAIELWWSTREAPAPRRSLLPALVIGAGTKLGLIVVLQLVWLDVYTISSGSMAPTLEVGDRIISFEGAYWFSEPEVGDVVVFDTPCQPGKIYVKRVVATAGDRVELRCGTLYLNDTELESSPAGDCPLREPTESPCRRVRERARGAAWTVANPEHGGTSLRQRTQFDFPVRQMFAPCDGVSPPGEFLPSRGGAPDCPRQGQLEVPPGHVFILGDNRANSVDSRIWGPIAIERIRGRATGVWLPASWGRIGSID